MRFLRTVSTQRLLAIVAGVIIAAAGGTAIAVAASGSGARPPAKSLAKALHQAATAPQVSGISARIKFTNKLIGSTNLQGTDPILSGASGRLWMSNNGRLHIELQGDNGDAQIVLDNGNFSIYDPMSNTIYKGSLPSQTSSNGSKAGNAGTDKIPTVAQIQMQINQLLTDVNVVGPLPRNVAGRPAYKVVISPRHDGGLLGSIQLAWDATHGVPLGIAVYAQGSSDPVLELKATDISYGPVSSRDLTISGHPGAKVVKVSSAADHGATAKSGKRGAKARRADAQVTGPAAVQAHLPFTLAAPDTLVGLSRQSVQLLDWGGSPAALVTYGQGLGGIAVIQQSASGQSTAAPQTPSGGDHQGLSLPTVTINGNSGQELATALGTVIRFSNGKVEYTVLGSVPAAAAEAAARALP